ELLRAGPRRGTLGGPSIAGGLLGAGKVVNAQTVNHLWSTRISSARFRGNGWWQLPSLLVATLVVVALRILCGHSHYTEGLPFYSIDENDIVDPAAGFLMGEWNHQYYTYGPAFLYLLSLLYAAAAFLKGQSIHLFATDVFFDAYWHYYLARLLSL